jgi:oligopeptidase B
MISLNFSRMVSFGVVMSLTACSPTLSLVPEMPAPKAKQQHKVLESHGHQRNDPWFWLRDDDRKNTEVLDYLRSENAYTEAALRGLEPIQKELFEELKGRLKKDDSSVPTLSDGYWYYHRYEANKEHPIHCRRKGAMTAPEEVILDVNTLAVGHDYYKIGSLSVSRNGRFLAFAEDTVSRRIYTIRVKDLETGGFLADRIGGTSGAIAWAENTHIFYVRRDPVTLRAHAVTRHALGSDAKDDVVVHDETDDTYYVSVSRSKSREYIVLSMSQTLTTEIRVVPTSEPTAPATPVIPRVRGHEYEVAHFKDRFYVLSNKDALNFRLMSLPASEIGRTDFASVWSEVIPERNDVLLTSVDVFDEFVVLSEREDALDLVRIVPHKEGPIEPHYVDFGVALYSASVAWNPEFSTQKLRINMSSPVIPQSVLEYDVVTKATTVLKRDTVLGGFEPENYETERAWAPSRDGKRIPVSIVYRKGTSKNGQNPVYQYGYGSYGYTIEPGFSSSWLSLLDRGFVMVIAHIRGSQAMGRRWYDDGKMFNKKNTFNDFIDVSKFLIEEGWTNPSRLVCAGGSAGGLLIGAVINMRPDLYAAAHAAVPFVDVVSTMLDESIPLTTGEFDEWGNPKNKDSYDYMLSYSPYDNVKEQSYPHLLVTTGLHDSQVQYWEPAKWVAKLRAMGTGDRLLLLETDMETGHGGASGRFERYRRKAMEYTFFLHVLGLTKADVQSNTGQP